MHWDEGRLNKATDTLFLSLAALDEDFLGYDTESKALEIVKFLNWRTWGNFHDDMLSLT